MKKVIILSLLLLFTVTLLAQEAKYEFKSAIIKTENTVGEVKIPMTTYIDDYGKKECLEFTVYGIKFISITVESAQTIIVNMNEKTAIKTQKLQSPNFLKLTDEVKESNNIKELGEETVGEKTCKKYSLVQNQMGRLMNVNTWIWKGFAIKTETINEEPVMYSVATEIQENVAIPASKFVTPEGISGQEQPQ